MTNALLYRTETGETRPIRQEDVPEAVRMGRITAFTPILRGTETTEALAGIALPRLFAIPPPYTGGPLRGGPFADTSPHPWRRFLARTFDVMIVGDILFVILLGIASSWPAVAEAGIKAFFERRPGMVVEGILATLLAVPANALSTAWFGTTLGKSIAGIRILKGGICLPIGTAFRRELSVWFRGQAFGLPLFVLFANFGAYQRLKQTGTTSWDSALAIEVSYRPLTGLRWIGMALAALLLAALVALSYAL